MGRVRVRVAGDKSKPFRVDVSQTTTVGELRNRIVEGLLEQKDDVKPEDLNLSLNQREAIEAEDAVLIREVGICSGDLVWLLNSELKQSTENNPKEIDQEKDGQINQPATTQGEPISVDPPLDESPRPSNRSEESRSCDATNNCITVYPGITFSGSHFPKYLRDALNGLTGDVGQTKLMSVIVHSAMIETGFQLADQDASVPNWSDCPSGMYVTHYKLPDEQLVPTPPPSPPPKAIVQCVAMGNHCLVYGTVQHSKIPVLTSTALNLSKYLKKNNPPQDRAESGNVDVGLCITNLEVLWKDFKDRVAIPTMFNVGNEVGCTPRLALQSLPDETKEIIFGKLDFRDLLQVCQVCSEFNRIGSLDRIWAAKYSVMYYGGEGGVDGNVGIKKRFQLRYEQEEGRKRRRTHPPVDPFVYPHNPFVHPNNPFGHPNNPGFGNGVPGLIGGDLDRIPQPFLGHNFLGQGAPFPFGMGRGARPGRGRGWW